MDEQIATDLSYVTEVVLIGEKERKKEKRVGWISIPLFLIELLASLSKPFRLFLGLFGVAKLSCGSSIFFFNMASQKGIKEWN